jgi:hypothetical protein
VVVSYLILINLFEGRVIMRGKDVIYDITEEDIEDGENQMNDNATEDCILSDINKNLAVLGIERIPFGNREYFKVDDLTFKDISTAILEGIFECCGCGNPKQAIYYITHGLGVIDHGNGKNSDNAALKEMIYGKSEYFFYYMMEKFDMIDHGVAAPGWLTEKGKAVLYLLKHEAQQNLFSKMSDSEGE